MKIVVKNVSHTYRTYERGQGLKNSLKDLFRRKYIFKEALKDVSFEIDENEILGIAGPNGAGKTTLLKILSGLIEPSEGYVQVGNYTPYKKDNDFKKQIGFVMGGKTQLIWELPGTETFALNQIIYDIPKQEYERWKNELITLLGVEDIVNIPVRNLSLGQKMKLDIIAALIHHPTFLFLDEPTNGLDVVSRISLRTYLKKIFKELGIIVIITSHNVGDIEALCDRLMILKEGSIVYDGNVETAVKKYSGKNVITLTVGNELTEVQKSKLENMEFEKIGDFKYQKNVQKEHLNADLKEIADLYIESISIEEGSLEDALVNVFTHTI